MDIGEGYGTPQSQRDMELRAPSAEVDSVHGDILGAVGNFEYWVENWWLPLAVGLLVLLVGASFSGPAQRRVWRPLGRGLRWVTTIRVTTTARIQASLDEANQVIREQQSQYVALRSAMEKSAETKSVRIAVLEDQLAAAGDATRNAVSEQIEQNALANERARQEGRREGYSEAMHEVEAQRSALRPRPVWRVSPMENHEHADAFALSNVQPDSGPIGDVWIEARMHNFVFNSGTQWTGPWREPVVFRGERTGAGRTLDVKFAVHYQDENDDWRVADAVLPAPRARPRIGKVARVDPDEPLGGLRF